MEMNSLNRVELRGRIGQDPRITNVGESQVARFSVATNETFKDKKGELKEETTWHNITAWSGKTIDDFRQLKKGTFVSVVGKLRNVKFTTASGEDRQFVEILASRLNVVQDNTN
ncbi:MAG: single-stranded DNA-binding protein [Bacteroidales bacterium]|nr:single-stranded DNA-binding protein [Bacteroidales bacterium]MDD4669808.1 single-stranded DNA-binding protein [Bacteroidales bacterium]